MTKSIGGFVMKENKPKNPSSPRKLRENLGFLSLGLAHFLIAFALGSTAAATTIHLTLGTTKRVDPQTGVATLQPLNPSGLCELTFIPNGLKLDFIDHDQNPRSLRVFFDYHQLDFRAQFENADAVHRQALWNAIEQAQQNGALITGNILIQMLKEASPAVGIAGEGTVVLPTTAAELFFKTQHRPGYIHTDFDASETEFTFERIGPTSLKTFLFETLVNSELRLMALRQKQLQQQAEATAKNAQANAEKTLSNASEAPSQSESQSKEEPPAKTTDGSKSIALVPARTTDSGKSKALIPIGVKACRQALLLRQ